MNELHNSVALCKENIVDESLAATILGEINKLDTIASVMNYTIINYALNKQTKASKNDGPDIWKTLTQLPDSLKNIRPIIGFTLQLLKDEVKSKDQMAKKIDDLVKAGFKRVAFQKYVAEYISLDSSRKIFSSLLVNSIGDTLEFSKLMKTFYGSYVFVDVWASWCVPCRKQLPYLQKTKHNLGDKNIIFLSISIDNDDQHVQWLQASESVGLSNPSNNYRLVQGVKNTFLQVNKIETAPRYLLYDKSCQLVNDDFITPDHKNFEKELLSYIK